MGELRTRFGSFHRIGRSHSLLEIGNGAARVYVRFSKVHPGAETFYGLRQEDLRQLEGRPSVLCFLWPGQELPLIIPFAEYEDVFGAIQPCPDGQYKVQTFLRQEGTVLYVERGGRFNVEGHFGWEGLLRVLESSRSRIVPEFSHCQVQTLLGAIGSAKAFDVWIPPNDRNGLDWSITEPFPCWESLPARLEHVGRILSFVDVIWLTRGSPELRGLFEIEQTTSIYSGLLRLNDICLAAPVGNSTFAIVAKDAKREAFVQQVNRPTFQASGLNRRCNFHTYADVFAWFRRIKGD